MICFALYTVHADTLKLTAQLYPLKAGDPKTARLEIERGGKWVEVAQDGRDHAGFHRAVPRRELGMTPARSATRVAHGAEATYEGIIRRNPVDKDEIVVASFTGNSIHPGHGGDLSRPGSL